MDGKTLNTYIQIDENMTNGNWSTAANIALEHGFDAYLLIECTEHFIEAHDIEYMNYKDVAILSMYIERLRYENKENGWLNK